MMDLVAVQREGSVVVVVPTMKRLDAGVAPAFKQEVVRLIEAGDTRLLIDMGGVQFLDSSGLGAIVSILKAIGNRGTLAVCNVQGAVLALFQLTRMDRVFALHPTREDAMARLGE